MATAPQFYSELPREVFMRLQTLFLRPTWGRTYLVTLTLEDLNLSTPVLFELDKVITQEHNRTILVLIGSVLPDKVHLLVRAASLEPGRFRKFEDAMKDLKERMTGQASRSLRRPGTLFADAGFVRAIESEQEMFQIAMRIYRSPLKDGLCKDPMRYPHLLLP